jgi:hypothetical protein
MSSGRRVMVFLALALCALSAAAPAAAKPKLADLPRDTSKINPRLAAQMEQVSAQSGPSAAAATRLPTSIWLNVPDPPAQRVRGPMSAAASQAAIGAQLDRVQSYMAPKRQGVVNALAQMGVQADTPVYGPAVFADLTPAQIRRIAPRADVATIYGQEPTGPSSDDAATTHRAYVAWQRGILGVSDSMIRPVVHEENGISDTNPFLNNGTHGVYFWCAAVATYCPSGKNITDHPSVVAGEIASTHALFRGVAPTVQSILSANFGTPHSDERAVQAFEWARGNGGDPFNMSWGTFCGGFQTFFSRYVDWAIRNLFATVVAAAGNHPTPCGNVTDDEQVQAPGLAYSAITVGNHTDNGNGFWAGDAMNAGSDWRDPDFASIVKPEVAAVGTNITATDNQGGDWLGTNWEGTSMAAPQVAGQVALAFVRAPHQRQWPETNKAAVLASAYHDIEAGRERDGVGSVAINVTDDIFRNFQYVNDCNVSCLALQPSDFPRTYSFFGTAGQVYRVAIAWDSNSTGGAGTDTTGADIDLVVDRPDTTQIASSLSLSNTWEMVEFTADQTGTYTVEALLPSHEATWPGSFLGMAYSQRTLSRPCDGTTIIPATGGTFPVKTNNGPTFFDTWSGWGPNNSGREAMLRITLPSTKDLQVTDTHTGMDLHVAQMFCQADPVVPVMKGSAANNLSIDNLPAGTYFIVVDGRNQTVSNTNVTVSVTGP